MTSIENLLPTNNSAPSPENWLARDPHIRQGYLDFYEANRDTPDNPQSNIVAHGATPQGEAILACQEGHDYRVASFDFQSGATTNYQVAAKFLLGSGDHSEAQLLLIDQAAPDDIKAAIQNTINSDGHGDIGAYEKHLSILLLTRSQDGNQWYSPQTLAPVRLRDMRLALLQTRTTQTMS